ncbi:MAG TPA: hypothetical protein VI653_24280 [Steroidobacteraceae bacterium]
MSYDLHLYFDKGVSHRGFLEYFAGRRHFTTQSNEITYQNPDTGVGFLIRYDSSKGFLARKSIGAAHFELSYFRPSYFGLETEIELSALVANFAPRIEDPQIQGMGSGPYSGEGFLRGWNYGNSFAAGAILASHPQHKVPAMPAHKLLAAWKWNYNRQQRLAQVGERQFVPGIMTVAVANTPSLVVVWALGMPVVLPAVDYVLVGRDEGGVKRYGLAPWTEVLAQLRRAAIDVSGDPLDIQYPVTPAPIARWVAQIPAVDVQTLPRLAPHEIIDSEILEAASRPRT